MTLACFTSQLGVFVSQTYADRLAERRAAERPRAAAEDPVAFAELDWITWASPYERVAPRPMLERAIPDFTPAFASDNYLVLRAAVRAGIGAMILDRRQLAGSETDGLVEIDLGFSLPPSEFYLVCAKSMQHVPRVRAVCEHLERDLGEQVERAPSSVSSATATR